MPSLRSAIACILTATACTSAAALPRRDEQECRKTQVAILGAGVAGITTAWALHNASIDDFVIVERNNYIGGRMAHTTFGKNPQTGRPYTVELGANWVQGLGSPGGPENPIWTFAKQYNISNTVSIDRFGGISTTANVLSSTRTTTPSCRTTRTATTTTHNC